MKTPPPPPSPTFPPAVMGSHTAVVGKTGSGKTITSKALIEQAYDEGSNVCVLDPIKSDWWGLTLAADGKRPGLPFHILGGPVGHVPLHADAGDALGRVVATGALRHSIIDMADFGPGEHNQFYNAFAEALFRNKTKGSGTLYLVLEEAHVFCPKERDGVKGENMAVFWTKRIATAARSKGVRIIATTQRTQALHNAVLGSCETVIAHRLTFPADQRPVLDWLKASAPPAVVKDVAASLASLKTGEGWLCSGEAQVFERVVFPMIRTFDNSSTPVDGAGHDAVRPPAVDQAALKAIVGEAVKEAEANDPKKLRERIEQLEDQLRDALADGPGHDMEQERRITEERDQARDDLADMRRHADELERQRDVIVRHFAGLPAGIAQAVGEFQSRLEGIVQLPANDVDTSGAITETKPAISLTPRPVRETPRPVRETSRPIPDTPRVQMGHPAAADPGHNLKLDGTQRRLIDACAAIHAATRAWPSRNQLGWWAGVKPTGGHFNNSVGPLVTSGLLRRTAGGYELTDEGRAVASSSVVTTRVVRDRIMGMLDGTQQRMLKVLIAHRGKWIGRADLGSECDPPVNAEGGHFNNSIGPMVTGGLVERSSGTYRLAEWMARSGV